METHPNYRTVQSLIKLPPDSYTLNISAVFTRCPECEDPPTHECKLCKVPFCLFHARSCDICSCCLCDSCTKELTLKNGKITVCEECMLDISDFKLPNKTEKL